MDTLRLSARITLRLDLLTDVPQSEAIPSDLADSEAFSDRLKRPATPFDFEVTGAPQPGDLDLPSSASVETTGAGAEQDSEARGHKPRTDTSFSFERSPPAEDAPLVAVSTMGRRANTNFSFERQTTSTDGGLTLAEIREAIAGTLPTVQGDEAGRKRTSTSFEFEVTMPTDGGAVTDVVRVLQRCSG